MFLMRHRRGAFLFSQSVLPLLLNSTQQSTHPPSLIFTGATAAMKGSAQFAAFSTGKFAKRSLSQSLAREFGPKGVHVAHVNVDGIIDIERTKEWTKNLGEDATIKPEAVSCLCGRASENPWDRCLSCGPGNRLRMRIGTCIHSPRRALHRNWT